VGAGVGVGLGSGAGDSVIVGTGVAVNVGVAGASLRFDGSPSTDCWPDPVEQPAAIAMIPSRSSLRTPYPFLLRTQADPEVQLGLPHAFSIKCDEMLKLKPDVSAWPRRYASPIQRDLVSSSRPRIDSIRPPRFEGSTSRAATSSDGFLPLEWHGHNLTAARATVVVSPGIDHDVRIVERL